jgi:hypothetical protein
MDARRVWLALALCACDGGSSTSTDGAAVDARVVDAGLDAEPDPDAEAPWALAGTVVDADFVPVAGQTVIAVATGETAVTDAAGHFTMPGVTAPPYDLAVWDPSSTSGSLSAPSATVYVGLTRPDPVIVMLLSHPQRRSATRSVNVPAGYPSPDHVEVLDAPLLSSSLSSASGSAFDFRATWPGPATTSTGTIRSFVQTKDGSGKTTAVTHLGTVPSVVFTDGTGGPLLSLTYGAAPPTATIAGTVSFPAADRTLLFHRVQLGAGTALAQGFAAGAGAFSLLAPDPAGATQIVCAQADLDTGYDPPVSVRCAGDLDGATTGVVLDVPAWGDCVAPADGVVAAREGPYTWTAPEGGVSILHVAAQVVGSPSFFVVTAGTTATLPALDGVPVAGTGTQYAWRVYTYPDVAIVDDAAAPGFPRGTGILGPAYVRELWGPSLAVTKTESRFFTTP